MGSLMRIPCLLAEKVKLGMGLIIKDIRSHIDGKINSHKYEKNQLNP